MARLAAAVLLLTACAPGLPPDGVAGTVSYAAYSAGEEGGQPDTWSGDLELCVYSVTRGDGPADDLHALDVASGDVTISATWRGGGDWYPITVGGTVAEWPEAHPCPVVVDLTPSGWSLRSECDGRTWTAIATRCER